MMLEGINMVSGNVFYVNIIFNRQKSKVKVKQVSTTKADAF